MPPDPSTSARGGIFDIDLFFNWGAASSIGVVLLALTLLCGTWPRA